MWVSEHRDLIGDTRLGDDQQQRFLPTRFDVAGSAIDARGVVCESLGCPNCHLPIPRALLEMAPMFVSIMGTPSCGKSYLLAAMTWQLRQVLPKFFGLSFADADPTTNRIVNSYEEDLFLNPDPNRIHKLRKTEEHGDLYDAVRFGEQLVTLPRPFVFSIRPMEGHPNYRQGAACSRIISLYDNAGESFEPGKDTFANPVTRHLAQSRVLMYLFDPTQDPRFREACRQATDDPQVLDQPVTSRQETVLHEVADRIRRHTGLGATDKHDRPLLVVVTKYDVWWRLLGDQRFDSPWDSKPGQPLHGMDLDRIESVSAQIRRLLWEHSPEMVASAEGFAEDVIYFPASATGCGTQIDEKSGVMGVRPKDIQPMWAEVPLLYSLCRWGQGMIPYSAAQR